MGKHKNKHNLKTLLVVILLSGIFLGCSLIVSPDLSVDHMVRKLLWPLWRLILLIGIGLVAGQTIEAFEWTGKLAFLARPLFWYGHLGDRCSAAFTTAFLSGAAANAMLLDFYKDGRISRRQLYSPSHRQYRGISHSCPAPSVAPVRGYFFNENGFADPADGSGGSNFKPGGCRHGLFLYRLRPRFPKVPGNEDQSLSVQD